MQKLKFFSNLFIFFYFLLFFYLKNQEFIIFKNKILYKVTVKIFFTRKLSKRV